MSYPVVRGISAAYQRELIGLIDDLIATDHLDADVERRARWLNMALQGNRPDAAALPYVRDTGPLAPAQSPVSQRARVRA
jgi:hypothetical protein